MLINDLKNKKIAVWGLGAEGQQIVQYLQKHKITQNIILLNDDIIKLPVWAQEYSLFYGENLVEGLNQAEIVIRSPGVSIYRDEIIEAKKNGTIITSVTDLCLNEFLKRPNCKVIGISGSKGKSTSASVLAYILQNMGYKTALGGNIGTPMIELLDGDYEYVVEEFSSYQASDLTASPHIAMFTNLYYVHSDWHHGHENYCRDKIHLIANQTKGDVYFANFQNPQLLLYTKPYETNRRWYNTVEGFYAQNGILYHRKNKIVDIRQLKINGFHNMENLAGVFSILEYLGMDIDKAAQLLKDFEPLPHRLQKVLIKDNVCFINDSISTAPEAAIGAINSFDGNIVLISGGQDNQQDYRPYAQAVEENQKVKMVLTLFQTGPKIASFLRQYVKRKDFELVEVDNLEQAVKLAYQKLKVIGGGTVLFSPTSPSFGYYHNFMERGNHFIKIVHAL